MSARARATWRQDRRRGSRRARPAAWAALLVGAAALWGCAPQRVLPLPPDPSSPPPAVEEAARGLWLRGVEWTSLVARCQLRVRSDRLPGPNQMVFPRGVLYVQKAGGTPPQVNLRVPDKGNPQVLLVGDGSRYLMDMPVFRLRHQGSYGDALPPETLRFCLLPEDVVDALHPAHMLEGHGWLLRQDRMGGYWVDSIAREDEPAAAIYISSSVRVSTRDGSAVYVVKYNRDGTIRVLIEYLARLPVETVDGTTVEVPAVIQIAYPGRDAAFELQLTDVEVDAQIAASQFELGS